jgi:hypothetical protein
MQNTIRRLRTSQHRFARRLFPGETTAVSCVIPGAGHVALTPAGLGAKTFTLSTYDHSSVARGPVIDVESPLRQDREVAFNFQPGSRWRTQRLSHPVNQLGRLRGFAHGGAPARGPVAIAPGEHVWVWDGNNNGLGSGSSCSG